MGNVPQQTEPFISPDTYLEGETRAKEKHEYYDGEVVPMAGASINHNYIVGNLYILLRQALKGMDFIPFSTDIRLWIPACNVYTYPDILVTVGKPACHNNRDDTLTNPILLIEVLSESTSSYDRGEKFICYRTIPTLRDYLLVDQSQCLVEHFARFEDNRWLLTEYHEMEAIVQPSCVPIQLALHDVYEQVEFPSPPERSNEHG